MTARMVNAIARTIPTVNLAGFGFGAMYPSWPQIRRILWGIISGRCVNYFTLRISIILMETIKDLYKRALDHYTSPRRRG
jgi:hypothetical protein